MSTELNADDQAHTPAPSRRGRPRKSVLKITRSYRLNPEVYAELARQSEDQSRTETTIIEFALGKLFWPEDMAKVKRLCKPY